MSPRRARSLPLLVLASVVLLEHLSPVHTLAPILSGKQRRYLRAEAGRLEASKQLRRVQVMEVARSAAELSAVLEAKEMARCKFMSAAKKSDAKILAQEMSELTDSTVAQVRPPPTLPPNVSLSLPRVSLSPPRVSLSHPRVSLSLSLTDTHLLSSSRRYHPILCTTPSLTTHLTYHPIFSRR